MRSKPNQGADASLLLALFGALFATAAGTHALTPIFPELKAALSASDQDVRLLTSVFTIGYALSGFALGLLCDRLGRRRILLWSLAGYAAASALLALPIDYPEFLALRALAGIATGGVGAAAIAGAADAVPYERRGRAMAIVTAGSQVAVLLGLPLANQLAKVRLTLFFAVLALVAAAAWLALAPRVRADAAPEPRAVRHSVVRQVAAALCLQGAPGILVATFCNTAATFAAVTSLADHAVDRFGASLDQRTLVFLALGCGALPGAAAAGALSDRCGKRPTVLVALALSIAATPLFLLPRSLGWFVATAALVAVVSGLRQGPFAAILTGLAPSRLRGTLVGLNSLASGVGLAAGTYASGATYASAGLGGGVLIASILLAVSLAVFAAAVPEGAAEISGLAEESAEARRRDALDPAVERNPS